MNIKELLPIGSIVRLQNGQKRLMITGVLQSKEDELDKQYDYLGILYPEGHIGGDFQYLFNQEDIDEIFFRGYEDQERQAFLEKLASFYQQ